MAALDPDDPRSIGGYQLLERLGVGGMGRVFLGRSPGGRRVAVKVVHAALVDQPDFRSRFRREVQAARAVSGAFTAPVIDADPDAAKPWLVTSYIAGPSLEKEVANRGPMPAPRVFALGAGLAEALVSIHSAHLIHRDLKPSNVLLAEDGPRVIDFGIARAVEGSSLTVTGYALGSPGFMSPEQVNGEEIGPASDVFSLGTVLAYAATGGNPFGNGHLASLLYRVAHDTPELDAIADPALRALIAACLAKDPAQRPTPRELLTRCGAGAGAAAPVAPHATDGGHGAPHGTAPSGRTPAQGGGVDTGNPSHSPGAGGAHGAVPGGTVTPGARTETAYLGQRPTDGATPPPIAPQPPPPASFGTPTPPAPVPVTPTTGPTPTASHYGFLTPPPGTATTQPSPTGAAARRGPSRRVLLISAAAAAAVAAVGVPTALTLTHSNDTTQNSAPAPAPPRPADPKPVGAWRLDEGSGTTAADSAGAHNGTASDVRWGVGNSGAALFNGVSSQIITRDQVLDTTPGHSFTISAWAYLTSANGFATVVSQGTTGGSAFYLQYSGADHRWAFSRLGVRTLASKPPALNAWTHLVGVCDATTHRLHLYVNGVQQGTATDSNPNTAPGPLIIGRATFDGRPVDFFSGGIKNVQVFDRALTPDQVAELN
ncbi:protein kinase domain-containing protein [Streptomyces sp. WZ-12]|uniref:protein kinase domain-containing protein n=1 Tax=Streptomyces sp. WZ-12 TaxID=3030210 RepID=UPI0023811D7C|nr:LamG-like jellyroll fold domain-containing protein [Streptomyces sp. WZ-12]